MSGSSFRYRAVDATGRTVRGTIAAQSDREAFLKLRSDGLTPLLIEASAARESTVRGGGASLAEIAALTRELSSLVEARVPLHRGLLSIAESEPRPELAAMIRDVAARLESGEPLTAALQSHARVFGEVYIETVRAAEHSGNLTAVMSHLADMLDRQITAQQAVRRAMAYPAIVLSVVSVAMSVIIVFVVPRFAETFAAHDVQLPFVTRVIQAIGLFARDQWAICLGSIAMAPLGMFFGLRWAPGRNAAESLVLRIPYIRKIVMAVTTARFAQVFGIGLSSGLDVIDSLESASRSTGRPIFVAECTAMAERLRAGDDLAEVIRHTEYLPHFAKRMIGAGKDATELSRSCGVVSRHFERESDHLLKNINSLIEPLLTVALASVVLVVALSVFLPMWQMMRLAH